MSALDENLLFENATIRFRNFAGIGREFNSPGDRNFSLFLDAIQADEMKKLGMNVKYMKPREEGDEPQAYIKVNVKYGKGRPPRIVLVTSRGRQELDESTVGILDYADLSKVDLTINPWAHGREGLPSTHSAFLKTGFFFMNEDALELKYADLPDANPTTELSSIVSEEVAV